MDYLDHETDHNLENSIITRLTAPSQINGPSSYSYDQSTIIIHPSTTRLTSKSEANDTDNDIDNDSLSSSSSYNISEGHTHSLSPSSRPQITEPSKTRKNEENEVKYSECIENELNARKSKKFTYKDLEQQMIDNMCIKNKNLPNLCQSHTMPVHPGNIKIINIPPPPPMNEYQYQYRSNYSNFTFYAFNHDNGTMIRLDLETDSPITRGLEEHININMYSPFSSQTPVTIESNNNLLNNHQCNINKSNNDLLNEFATKYVQISKHKKKKLNELLRFSSFKSLKHSLLKMENREMDKLGIQIWKNINSYMGLRKSSKSPSKHIEKILFIALNSNTSQLIRDEIYLQCIKQTNSYHIHIIDKLIKAWKLMSICCNIFCPSLQFAKYLALYLFNKTKDISFGNGIISKYAQFCLNALDQSMIYGQRKIEPIHLEIKKIENRQLIPIKIYFLDDTFITILVYSQTTIQTVCDTLSNKLRLKYPAAFSLYEMEEISIKKYNEQELKMYNLRLDMNYNEKVKHLDIMPSDHELDSNERIMDIFSLWLRSTNNKKKKKLRFVYKLKILNKYRMDQELFSLNEWKLIYLNNVWNVINCKYPINSEKDLLNLAAIQLQCDNNMDNIDINKYIPQNILTKYSIKECQQLIQQKQYCFYRDFTRKQCWKQYISYLYQLNEIYLFIGCIFFPCIQKLKILNINQCCDLIIGISENYILMIDPFTKQIIEKYKLEEILTYGFKSNSFIIVARTLLQQKKYQFITKYGKEMNNVLQRYIDIKSSM